MCNEEATSRTTAIRFTAYRHLYLSLLKKHMSGDECVCVCVSVHARVCMFLSTCFLYMILFKDGMKVKVI